MKKQNQISMVRTKSAGVFYGTIIKHDRKEAWVEMTNARRVWMWAGAASLSQLSQDGSTDPSACKFPKPVPNVFLADVIEILPMTKKAVSNLSTAPEWKI